MPSKTYYLGKMKKFREDRFSKMQYYAEKLIAFFKAYYLRKTRKFSVYRFSVEGAA
jgi:hypothetical protein